MSFVTATADHTMVAQGTTWPADHAIVQRYPRFFVSADHADQDIPELANKLVVEMQSERIAATTPAPKDRMIVVRQFTARREGTGNRWEVCEPGTVLDRKDWRAKAAPKSAIRPFLDLVKEGRIDEGGRLMPPPAKQPEPAQVRHERKPMTLADLGGAA
jgi:hypothetical protein